MTPRLLQGRAPAAFTMAGLFMLAQVAFIGLTRLGIGAFSEMLAAASGLMAVFASLWALGGLHPRLSPGSPRLAKAMVVLVSIAALMMLTAIVLLLVSRAGDPGPMAALPPRVLGVIGGFLIAYVLSFALAAVGSMKADSKVVAGLLLVPVICWGAIIIVGALGAGPEALKLDLYLNAVMAISFLGLGAALKSKPGSK